MRPYYYSCVNKIRVVSWIILTYCEGVLKLSVSITGVAS